MSALFAELDAVGPFLAGLAAMVTALTAATTGFIRFALPLLNGRVHARAVALYRARGR